MADDADDPGAQVGSIDGRHLLLVGAGPGLGQAVARRFAEGGYRVTLLLAMPTGSASSPTVWPTPAPTSTRSRQTPAIPKVSAHESRTSTRQGAPGVIVYSAVMGLRISFELPPPPADGLCR